MKKIVCVLTIVICMILSLSAYDNYANLLNTYIMPDFAQGTFPAGVRYELGLSGIDLIPRQTTRLAVKFDAGLLVRSLTQHPVDGSLVKNKEDQNLSYYSFISEGDAQFSQSFYRSPRFNNDYLTLSMSFKMRWEQAFRIFSLLPNTERASVFDDETYFPKDTIYYGAPELNGNGTLLTNSLNLGIKLSDFNSTASYSEGFRFFVDMSLAPWFLGNDLPCFDTFSDFIKFNMEGQFAYHLWDGEHFLGIDGSLNNVLRYQYLSGSAVPKHAQTISYNGLGFAFYSQIIMNEFDIKLVRPNVFHESNLISLDLKWTEGLGFGTINNTVHSSGRDFDHFGSVGVELDCTLFNILKLYVSFDYIYDNIKTDTNGIRFRYGGYISY